MKLEWSMEDVAAKVLSFYRELPFNYRETPQAHAEAIRCTDQLKSYPPLVTVLQKNVRLLDVGCGAGWLGLSAAWHYGCDVTALDFNDVVVKRGRAVAHLLGVPVEFVTADLFTYEPDGKFDVVTSVGVLHHTPDCHAAITRICTEFVRPGGYVFIGLYHLYGRRPFLEHFRLMRATGATEEDMLARYRVLHARLRDEVQLRSWFRDQVLHPHETQHTLRELLPTLERAGMALVSTSINGFCPLDDIAQVLASEETLEQVGRERLTQSRYYPGFFVLLARKRN